MTRLGVVPGFAFPGSEPGVKKPSLAWANSGENPMEISMGYPISRQNPSIIVEGSLEVKLPTIWTDEKQSRAEAERRGRLEERRSEEKE